MHRSPLSNKSFTGSLSLKAGSRTRGQQMNTPSRELEHLQQQLRILRTDEEPKKNPNGRIVPLIFIGVGNEVIIHAKCCSFHNQRRIRTHWTIFRKERVVNSNLG